MKFKDPGRELDALVAEKVMGWIKRPKGAGTAHLWISSDKQAFHESELPAYSTDIAAAWQVVEKLTRRDDKLFFTLETPISGSAWECWFSGEWAEGETASHAICLAALKAVGVEL